jgi:type IV pilus assembly protein PilW
MQIKSRQNFIQSNHGFTLIELLVAMVVAFLAMSAIYSTFLNQQKSYVVQQETAAMHQNIRAASFYMEKDIRMAGCDPTGSGIPGISSANPASIRFTEDVSDGAGSNPDGDVTDPNEDITYSLDGNRNLIRTIRYIDGGGANVVVPSVVAQNIDAIDFVYLDANSLVLNDYTLPSPDTGAVPAGSEGQIRSVEITIVARTGNNTLASPNNNPYTNQRGTQILGPQGDNVSRRRLTYSIKCRNLGL